MENMEIANTNIMYNEVYDFLNILGNTYIECIPSKFYQFIQNEKIPNYETHLDYNKNISSQISDNALSLIAYLNLMYWCSPQEKEELIEIYKQNDIKEETQKRTKYNPDNIFNKKSSLEDTRTQEIQMIEYKEPLWKRLINKIKNKLNLK